MQVWCLRKHLGKNGTGESGATDPKRGLVSFFHSRLQASPLSGAYANVQTLQPFRLNGVCLLTF